MKGINLGHQVHLWKIQAEHQWPLNSVFLHLEIKQIIRSTTTVSYCSSHTGKSSARVYFMLALSVWSRGWILSFWFLTGTVCAQNNETAKSNMPIKNFHLKNRLCKQNTLKAVLYGILFLLTEYWTNSIL